MFHNYSHIANYSIIMPLPHIFYFLQQVLPVHKVCTALIELAKNPDIDTKEIMKYIKGPDFPTGGVVENYDELIEFYEKGRGQVRIRAKAHVEKLPGGREQIVITEIPYQVNKAELKGWRSLSGREN
jgi:DNA gyrase/topoisomerase IV subunit A